MSQRVMKNIAGIILAAGEGRRMKSTLPKVLHPVCGRPMLMYTLELLNRLGVERKIVVVGHKQELVKELLLEREKTEVLAQPELLGSADAVRRTQAALSDFQGDVLILYGDTPLITLPSLKRLIRWHKKNRACCTLLTAHTSNPYGFGRIIRGADNQIMRIVEEQDASAEEKGIKEINAGAYCFKAKELFLAIGELNCDNAKGEYYLTDTIEVLSRKKEKIESVCAEEEAEARGVNSRQDLSIAWAVINKRNIEELSLQGVTVVDPATTYICGPVEVGRDTIIYPHTVMEGEIKIGRACQIGPFARIRGRTVLKDNVEIGNFVEVVRSTIGSGSKIKHHSYIGDTTVGKGVNIGAGTITANYDGQNKNPTFIGDGAFIGVGTILIAPVKIGKGAITGAGSVVTKNKDVPAGVTVAGVPARILKRKQG